MVVTQYLQTVFNITQFRDSGNKILGLAKYIKFLRKFDSIAFTGVSGAAFAPMLSYQLNVSLLAVRKPSGKEKRHSSYDVEGEMNSKKYLIVDDCIATGATIKRIVDQIAKVSKAKPVAILLYNQGWMEGPWTVNNIVVPIYMPGK